MGNANIRTGMDLPFELTEKARDDKISPILQLATPEDAQAIVDIYLDIYQGTYSYKEMEIPKIEPSVPILTLFIIHSFYFVNKLM